jgi:hypothetical protein
VSGLAAGLSLDGRRKLFAAGGGGVRNPV